MGAEAVAAEVFPPDAGAVLAAEFPELGALDALEVEFADPVVAGVARQLSEFAFFFRGGRFGCAG